MTLTSEAAPNPTTRVSISDLTLDSGSLHKSYPPGASPKPTEVHPMANFVSKPAGHTLVYNLTTLIPPVSATGDLRDITPLINKALQHVPTFPSSKFLYAVSLTAVSLNLDVERLWPCLELLDDWIGESEFNSYCSLLIHGCLTDPTLLKFYLGAENPDVTFNVKGRDVTFPRYGSLEDRELTAYRAHYKAHANPDGALAQRDKDKAEKGTDDPRDVSRGICELLER